MHPRTLLAAVLPFSSALLACAQVHESAHTTVRDGPVDRFIGAWHLDSSKISSTGGGNGAGRGAGGGNGGGLGMGPSPDVLVIRAGSGNLTVDQLRGESNTRLTFALDGRRVTNTIGAADNARQGTYVSKWAGDTLITTIAARAPPGGKDTVTYRDVRYIDSTGSLVVEISIPARVNSRRAVYTKAQ